jgi:hypothetical protein
MRHCDFACAWSAARRYYRTASAASWATPVPRAWQIPILCCASANPRSAARRHSLTASASSWVTPLPSMSHIARLYCTSGARLPGGRANNYCSRRTRSSTEPPSNPAFPSPSRLGNCAGNTNTRYPHHKHGHVLKCSMHQGFMICCTWFLLFMRDGYGYMPSRVLPMSCKSF